ncbi:MAG: serine/threonine-protein kinase [Pseudomonadota bacterium]
MSDRRSTEPREAADTPAWEAVAATFDSLAEAEPAERKARLAALERTEPALAAEVASLLEGLADEQGFLARPAADLEATPVGAGGHPERIDAYRVLDRLGRGGMGTVYRAVREDGPLDQPVAIKVVRAADGDPTRLQRFAREARLLSRLDHPGIARPLDAGTLDDDTAWLVMEYVDGVRIDRYCADAKLGRRERIRLIIALCEAVQFAHRNLVVHRDIKPANVLVDAEGRPRLLDFGIARMLEADDQGELTITGQAALTPRYASPEQFAGEMITTATDVYALGALAYELLCGRPPLDLDGLALPAMIERVCEQPPERPSVAAGDSGLRGDLDAILLTALRKEPARRYASAGDLAADLQRHLAGEPVLAHADSLRYRAGKFLRRHAGAVLAGVVFAVSLTVLATVATIQAIDAERARAEAEAEAARAASVLGFFQEMLGSADPAKAQGEDPTVRALLDRTATSLTDSGLDPLALGTVQETVASTYLTLGLPDPGLPLAESASALLTEALGEAHPRTLAARHAEARFHLYSANFARAIEILEPTFEARRRVLGDAMDTMSTLHNLAYAYAGAGEVERALNLDLVQLEIVERLSGKGSPEALTTMISVGHGYYSAGRLDEALAIFREVYEGQRAHLGERHPTTLSALHNYATLTRQTGAVEEAEARYRELVQLRREVLGDRHAQTLNSIHNLGELYLLLERPEDAAPHIEAALAGRREALGPGHPDSIESLVALTRLRLQQERPADARAAAEAAESLAREHLPPEAEQWDKVSEALALSAADPAP